MTIVRGTRNLLTRLRSEVAAAPPASTNVLGDWYADILFTKPQVVLCLCERTRLPVVIPAREWRTVGIRLPVALARVLAALGIEANVIEQEQAAMDNVVFAKTTNRSVLGTINDFAFATKWALASQPGISLHQLSLELAQTPVGAMGYDHPAAVARRFLATRSAW